MEKKILRLLLSLFLWCLVILPVTVQAKMILPSSTVSSIFSPPNEKTVSTVPSPFIKATPFQPTSSSSNNLAPNEITSFAPTSADSSLSESVNSKPLFLNNSTNPNNLTSLTKNTLPISNEPTPTDTLPPKSDAESAQTFELSPVTYDGQSGYQIDGFADTATAADRKNLVIPANYQGLPILTIKGAPEEKYRESAFYGESSIKTVQSAPNSRLQQIGVNGFNSCSNLQSVDLPSVVTLESYAFSSCEKLEQLNFPQVRALQGYVFIDDKALRQANFPQAEVLAVRDFSMCVGLESLSLPNVKKMGQLAFAHDTALQEIDLSGLTVELTPWAFYDCPNLKVIKATNLANFDNFKQAVKTAYVNARVPATAVIVTRDYIDPAVTFTWRDPKTGIRQTGLGQVYSAIPISELAISSVNDGIQLKAPVDPLTADLQKTFGFNWHADSESGPVGSSPKVEADGTLPAQTYYGVFRRLKSGVAAGDLTLATPTLEYDGQAQSVTLQTILWKPADWITLGEGTVEYKAATDPDFNLTPPKNAGTYQVGVLFDSDDQQKNFVQLDQLLTITPHNILPAEIQFTGTDKIYDGMPAAHLTAKLIGRASYVTDDVGLVIQSASYRDSLVGTEKPIDYAWQLTGADKSNYMLADTAHVTVNGTIKPADVNVTFETAGHGLLQGATSATVHRGEKLSTLPTPLPDPGYAFDHWEKAGQVVDPLKEKLTADTMYRAVFKKLPPFMYQVTFATDGHGKLRNNTPLQVARGEKLPQLPTPIANSGYGFSHWEKNGQSVANLKNEIVTGNTTYQAIFKKVLSAIVYHATFKAGEHGSLSGDTLVAVKRGEKIASLPKPVADPGYVFDHWEQNGQTIAQPKAQRVTGDLTYQAIFRKAPTVEKKRPLYRVYNPNSGEHFYTLHAGEKKQLVKLGWHDEGTIGMMASKGTPIYRLYNPNVGDHHYTKRVAERDQLVRLGWIAEGIAFYSGGNKKIYRLYNPNAITGAHHYTPSLAEKNYLVRLGWRDEQVGWYSY